MCAPLRCGTPHIIIAALEFMLSLWAQLVKNRMFMMRHSRICLDIQRCTETLRKDQVHPLSFTTSVAANYLGNFLLECVALTVNFRCRTCALLVIRRWKANPNSGPRIHNSGTMGATKLIFQGVKFYWRTRNTIDVTIVEHTEQDVTEVILFDPALGTEAPRVYLSTPVLYTKLDQEDFELQLSFAKRNSVPITEKFIDGMMNQAKSDFILNRLVITEYVVDLRRVVVSLQLSCVDVGADGLVCEKPAVLEPLKTVHYQTLM